MENPRYKKDLQVRLALLRTKGDVKAAAAQLGISRQALHDRLRRKPHLRPGREFPDDIDKLAASAQILDLALDRGEWWAVKQAWALSPKQKKPRRPRPTYSDEEVEQLVRASGERGVLATYWGVRESITPPGKLSLGLRRQIIEASVAVALQIPCSQVWKRLEKAWVGPGIA